MCVAGEEKQPDVLKPEWLNYNITVAQHVPKDEKTQRTSTVSVEVRKTFLDAARMIGGQDCVPCLVLHSTPRQGGQPANPVSFELKYEGESVWLKDHSEFLITMPYDYLYVLNRFERWEFRMIPRKQVTHKLPGDII